MIVQIPFQGFYGSELEGRLDQEVEFILEDNPEFDEVEEINWPVVFENTAKTYTEIWLAEMELEGAFHEMTSPRFYNFETDKVFVDFPPHSLEKIKAKAVESPEFEKFVEETCSSRDGFHSFLPSNLEDWDEEWESRYYYVALLFIEQQEEVEERVIEYMTCNGGFDVWL